MLQSKQISKVLTQGLRAASVKTSTSSPFAISLLSKSGLPLTTVTSLDEAVSEISTDNLKIYSLLAVNNFQSENVEDWTLLEFEFGIKAIIEKVKYDSEQDQEDQESTLYVVVFYNGDFPDAVAKLKLDNINAALSEGLKGYRRE
ncbi:hypothetical protein CLIB1423_30S00540 [[Candida] railenensis]|uniref:Uncharacterized protein n=1 Tax=[Candida] railenensis TaxID=45579 RepID=A0A9P0W007_9ASCO|nr:hypothetical protein CLIB1423_30S00540 [[Candida] railenensis]